MFIISPNFSDSRKALIDQIKTEKTPSYNWMEARLDTLDGGCRRERELLKDRIDGIPKELSRKTLLWDIREIFRRSCLSR